MTTFVYDQSDFPQSSFITGLFYSSEDGSLVVGFKTGSYSGYSDVTLDQFYDFIDAESTGSHYNRYFSGSALHTSFAVTDVQFKAVDNSNDVPVRASGDTGKAFTIVIQIKANDLLDAAKKAHEFTTDPFNIISISEG